MRELLPHEILIVCGAYRLDPQVESTLLTGLGVLAFGAVGGGIFAHTIGAPILHGIACATAAIVITEVALLIFIYELIN